MDDAMPAIQLSDLLGERDYAWVVGLAHGQGSAREALRDAPLGTIPSVPPASRRAASTEKASLGKAIDVAPARHVESVEGAGEGAESFQAPGERHRVA